MYPAWPVSPTRFAADRPPFYVHSNLCKNDTHETEIFRVPIKAMPFMVGEI